MSWTRMSLTIAASALLLVGCAGEKMQPIKLVERPLTASWEGVPPEDDLLSISTGTIEEPDIVWSPRIPHVGEKITLSARVRGKGAGRPVAVRFTLEAPEAKAVTLEAKPAAKRDGGGKYVDYEAQWQPTQTGFYRLSVLVDPGNKSGDPFTDNNVAEVTIPVTWTELHILSWYNPRRCRWVGTAAYCPEPEDIPYWRRRGTKPLSYMSIIERNLVSKSQEELTKLIVDNAKKITEAGYDGYLIDELGSYPTAESMGYMRRIANAYAAVKKQYPKLRGYNWTGGGMLREEADWARSAGHILMTEAYPDNSIRAFGTHSFEKRLEHRIQTARNVDALFGHGRQACMIVALGIGGDCGVPWRPHVENWVRVYRKLAPEAPGICYYGGGQREQWDDPEVNYQAFLDHLTLKYFLKPVLMIKETDLFLDHYDLTPGKTVNVTVRVRNIGGMAAKGVRVTVYARCIKCGKRKLIRETILPEIRNGIRKIMENDPPSYELREINGVTYPAMYYKGRAAKGTTWVYVDRALVTVPWTPSKSGYYAIEAEIAPSHQYTILDGSRQMAVAVRP